MKNFSLFILLLISSITNTFAQNGADSVFNPSLSAGVPAQSQASSTQGPGTTYTSTTEYQYGTCPAGFTYNGGSQFPLQSRTITNYYTGGQYVGTTTSPWYDMDADCQTTEYQQIACPVNYTGVYYQSRQVTTSDAGYQYGAWNTYANSCVYNPPITYRDTINDPSYIIRYGDAGSWTIGTGVAIDYANQELRCVSGYPTNGGGDNGFQTGNAWVILNRGVGFTDSAGCSLSGGNRTANIYASCAYVAGGDNSPCMGGSSTVTVLAINGCTMTVQISGYQPNFQPTTIQNYNLCQ